MFTLDIQTTIDIDTTAERIWQVLADFESYPQWNPMLINVRTHLEPGAEVRFEVALREGARPLRLKANINVLQTAAELAWRGGMSPLITGQHYFRIEPLDEQRCRFHHGEHFKGLLLPLLKPILNNASSLYEAMNSELKQRAEGLH